MMQYFRTLNVLNGLMNRAHWDKNKLEEYQNNKIKYVVNYAYENTKFYNDLFKNSDIKPYNIKNIQDIKKIPITSKKDLQNRPAEFISKEYDINNLIPKSTSGSTGRPLNMYISQAEDDYRKAKRLRTQISCGQKVRDKWVAITRPSHFSYISNFHRTLGFFAPVSISVFESSETQISLLEKINPEVLDGFASSLYLLAKEVEKRGLKTITPRVIFSGAELSDKHTRDYIGKVFGAPVYDQYASIEVERMAWQCPERNEYHIDADSILLEFLDEDGEEVAPGETGEIVVTSLFNKAMPLIRYAIGDVGIPSHDECPCGRTLPLMKIIEGRKGDLINLPDGRIMTPTAFQYVMRGPFQVYIDQWRVIQKKVDLLKIEIVKKKTLLNEETFEDEVRSFILNILNFDADTLNIDIEYLNVIPLEKSGKLRPVVSEM